MRKGVREHTALSGCSWRCQSSRLCRADWIIALVNCRLSQEGVCLAYPSSSSAMEILIPLGVCAVYRVMSGRLIVAAVAVAVAVLYKEEVEEDNKCTRL